MLFLAFCLPGRERKKWFHLVARAACPDSIVGRVERGGRLGSVAGIGTGSVSNRTDRRVPGGWAASAESVRRFGETV